MAWAIVVRKIQWLLKFSQGLYQDRRQQAETENWNVCHDYVQQHWPCHGNVVAVAGYVIVLECLMEGAKVKRPESMGNSIGTWDQSPNINNVPWS
jgi:hypothetical protein